MSIYDNLYKHLTNALLRKVGFFQQARVIVCSSYDFIPFKKKWIFKVQLCLTRTKNIPKVQMCNFNVYEYSLSQDMLGTFSLLLFYENIFEFLGYLLYFLAISWHFSMKSSNIKDDGDIFNFGHLILTTVPNKSERIAVA